MLASAVGAGVLAGVVTGGTLRNLARTHVRVIPIFVAGIVLRILALGPVGPDVQRMFYVLSVCALLLVSIANIRLVGAPLIALGLSLNAFAVATSAGAMPVASHAIMVSGTKPPSDALHMVSENVSPLADVIPVSFLGVYSIGDVILALGIATLIVWAMRTPQ